MTRLAALISRIRLDADLVVGVAGRTVRVRTMEEGIRLDFDSIYSALRFWRATKRHRLPGGLSALFHSCARDSIETIRIHVRDRMVLRMKRRDGDNLSFARSILWRDLFLSLFSRAT